jgi:phytoene desaturase
MIRKKIIGVGAGLGGMAAAIRLAHAGHDVEIWEQNNVTGGKVQEFRQDGFRWDMGPSLMTMPHILQQLFSDVGAKLEDYLTLERLACTCRYHWEDGATVDENAAFFQREDVARFLRYAAGIYALSGEAYLHHPPGEFWRAFRWNNLGKLQHLPKVATMQNLAEKVNRYFTDPHLRQLFHRFATYNGSSPYLTPATFNIIPYVEAHFGAWHPRGGMAQIGVALRQLAEEKGVRFVLGTKAEEFRQGELRATDGRVARPDVVICNQDAIQARLTWLKSLENEASQRALLRPDLSSSGYILFLGVKRRHERLSHHNIFFSSDYPREFQAIFQQKVLPSEPTIYVSVTARTDKQDAPPDCDNYFVLVNSPALAAEKDSDESRQSYASVVIRRLEKMGLPGLSGDIAMQEIFSVRDFARRDGAYHGALYGWASHSISSALFRPPLRHPRQKNIFFTGGTTHPGGGIPLVLLSGKMVAEQAGR